MKDNEDKTDPMCGMQGTIPAHGHYFCCEACLRNYEDEHNIPAEQSCPSCAAKAKKWYHQRLFIVTLAIVLLLLISFAIPFLDAFRDAFIDYLQLIWWAVLLGFLVGGLIDVFVPHTYIKKYLSRHRKRTILYAIVFGFLMSACSHGILAIAIELYKKGANTSSVIAFLLASPWANLPITFLLVGFFGVKAGFIIVSALVVATITGLVYQLLERNGWVECQHCNLGEDVPVYTDFSIRTDIKRRIKEYRMNKQNTVSIIKEVFIGSWSLSKMVLWWLLIGMVMAAVARAYIPQDLFVAYMGPTTVGLLVTLFFATIIEVCSEGSSPLAFEIYQKTAQAGAPAFGNSFTFLMAGVATDYTEIGLIWANIGRRAALWLPVITVPQILIIGYLFNLFI